ncbi:CoA transferase [Sphingobium phenoxybenzoativorans]|uniref:CoA transferase n=1 Tax=Sphingobium phenoxybenzoativorans TaxID=1592790 RepID=A0A975KAI4_9SPHN|nr:CoA transferase [Sphingobium phenoxybenzoativorans]QUT07823.1 CoA transferase [Sphingobium phenoxybenzoativorans]
MQYPLQGVKVLDLSRVLAGPYCGQLLADMGADVLKVESPEGDENRGWGDRTADGLSCNFSSVNRGKRSVVMNFKAPGAKEALAQLVRESDVVIESFLPESSKRLGITFEALKEIKPDVILCSITGYGSRGPMRDKPGYDLMMQAFSSVMLGTGTEDGEPVRCGVSFIDMSTGLIAYGGILTALHSRGVNGGCHVEVSLLRTAISILGYQAVNWLQTGRLPQRQGSGVMHLVPYQAFKCRDGYILSGATNDLAWRRFSTALGRPELGVDPRFATNDDRLQNRAELIALVSAIFETNDAAYWVEKFEENRVAISPLNTLDQVLTHDQLKENDILLSLAESGQEPKSFIGAPFTLNKETLFSQRLVPHLGADNDEILRAHMQLSDEQIERLTGLREQA